MQHMTDSVGLHHALHCRFVPQIDSLKDVLRMFFDARQINQVTSVGQAIQIDDALDFRPLDDMPNDIRANESSAACH